MSKPVLGAVALYTVMLLTSCQEPKQVIVEEIYYPRDSHEAYSFSMAQLGMDDTQLYKSWIEAHERAMDTPVPIKTPFQETFYFDDIAMDAYGYQFSIDRGQRTTISLTQMKGDSGLVFLDLFQMTEDTINPYNHIASSDTLKNQIIIELKESAKFLLRVQPELLRTGVYNLKILVEPSLAFPVSGRGERAIGSLFGVERDAGKRVHEGIDVFAKRHTPIVSVSDGQVTFAGVKEGSLGGNVIWARDTLRDLSIYYAHLEDVFVDEGVYVERGDTIGSVGNSGNAVTTYPHLHFGIYSQGAVDPFPYVVETRSGPSSILADSSWLNQVVRVNSPGGTNRNLYSRRLNQYMSHDEYARVIGVTSTFYKVKKATGKLTYVFYDHIKSLDRSIGKIKLKEETSFYTNPSRDIASFQQLPQGMTVKVLAKTQELSYCETPDGNKGWLKI